MSAAATAASPPADPVRVAGDRRGIVSVLGLAFAANAAAVVWLWLHGGGITGVHGTGDLLTSVGRVTGLVGTYLALVQLLLLARIPWLERLVGFDRLTVWHRRNGKTCLLLLLVHTALITAGYALVDGISVGSEIQRLLDSYPGIVTATVGTALLVVVVVSSLIIVRRRLPYEGWYALHLTTYAGLALAYAHQLPTGNEFSANPGQRDYWIALYVVTLALLVGFRVARPALRGLRHRMRVDSVTVEGPGVVSVRIRGQRLDRLDARAGQFFLWRFLTPGRWWQSHPFSLSAAPDAESLRITVKDVGRFTHDLRGLQPGARVFAEGPFGTFAAASRRRRRVALIAGGIGITPLRALYEELEAGPGDLALIYRALRDEDLIFRDELERLAEARGSELFFVVGDHRAPGASSLLAPEHLLSLVPDLADRDVYLCGPVGMMDAVRRSLSRAGVPGRQVRTERFALAA
jgi:predicted ferric reductase